MPLLEEKILVTLQTSFLLELQEQFLSGEALKQW